MCLNKNSYLKTTLSVSANKINWERDSVDINLIASPIEKENYINGRYDLTTFYNKKFNAKLNIKTGISIKNIFYNLSREYHSFSQNQFIYIYIFLFI